MRRPLNGQSTRSCNGIYLTNMSYGQTETLRPVDKNHLSTSFFTGALKDADGNGHDVGQDIVTESSTSNIAIYDPQPPSLPDWVTPSYSPQMLFLCGTRCN